VPADIEWGFTVLFTVEYGLRLLTVTHPWRYITSFFGVVDVLTVVPTYLSVVLPGGQYFLTVRILRLLRIFRILKLSA
jgi:voltage-gated potassium channel